MVGGEKESCSCGNSSCSCADAKEHEHGKGLEPVKAPRIYRDRRPVKGEVVTIIDVAFNSSGIELTESWSRAVSRGEVHEIMVWNPLEEGEEDAGAVAFIEITQGGNIVNGDEVKIDGEPVGTLSGFDYNHMPNHMNVVVEVKDLKLPLKLGNVIEFAPNPMLPLANDDCC